MQAYVDTVLVVRASVSSNAPCSFDSERLVLLVFFIPFDSYNLPDCSSARFPELPEGRDLI